MRVDVTSRERVLWPETGFTKGDLADYYRAVAPTLVPHLAGRPVTLRRFPEGVEGPSWFQDECRGAPAWMTTASVRGRRFCVLDSVDALVWVANLSAIELHPYGLRTDEPERATDVVFDLDPGEGATAVDCCAVAVRIRQHFPDARVKTSGLLGLHVYVPRRAPFADTKTLARNVAAELAAETPELVTTTQKRAARRGKVLVDWLQNDPTRSTVAPYSLRAAPWPLASTPLSWDEVERAKEPRELVFTAEDVLARLDRYGDLFAL
jgi:bifunctional non-homologous end joining protein LigD